MYLENIVFDAVDPQRVGQFWETVLGCERLADEPAGFETRLPVAGGPVLDLCFQRVPEPPSSPSRLRLDLAGGARRDERVAELTALGARRLGTGGAEAGSVRLLDPEGVSCLVLAEGAAYAGTGPLAALTLDSADPDRDAAFWSWLTGWAPTGDATLRHPSGLGPALVLSPEAEAKSDAKNRVHLDVRLETGDDPDAVAAGIADRGGRELHLGWGDLPWRHYADPSGNEFCVLPAHP
jgi:hypothetical protein